MQIKIDMKILIFLLIFYISSQLKMYILLMIFACIHELSHLALGIVMGFKPQYFEIKPVGFSVSFYSKMNNYNKKILKGSLLDLKRTFVYLIGPLTNVIIAVIIYLCNINSELKIYLMYINLAIAFCNLLPIYPLDGGRILKNILCIFCGRKNSYIIIQKVSKAMMIVLTIIGSFLVLRVHNWGIIIIIGLIFYIQQIESKRLKCKIKIYDLIETLCENY